MSVRVRYAPSPTGSPHVGNLRTAIYNWLFAHKEGGQFLARLEDTDRTPERYKPEAIGDIEESLRFLNIVPDEWWVSGGPVAPYVQSERLPLYLETAEKMIAAGNAYRCYCTKERLDAMRQQQQEKGLPTGYDRRCRYLSEADRARNEAEGLASVVRLAVPLTGTTVVRDVIRGDISYENRTQDDQVLLKSDGFPTYFLAATVDDHMMGITHIIRGDDWLSSAPKLVLLYQMLGWEPPLFAHLPLILGPDRKKLSKRHGATQFTDFIEKGYLPETLFNFLLLLGWSAGEENRELLTVEETLERFSLSGISISPAIFDYEKLDWMNGHYIRASQPERIIALCLPYLVRAGLISNPPTPEEINYASQIIPLEIERIKTLSDILDPERGVDFFFRELKYPDGYDEKAVKKWLSVSHLRALLEKEIAAFSTLSDWTPHALETSVRAIGEELGVKFAEVIHPTRVAATGRTIGPGLFETLGALGRERTIARLQSVLNNS